jgi:hypothetical protein
MIELPVSSLKGRAPLNVSATESLLSMAASNDGDLFLVQDVKRLYIWKAADTTAHDGLDSIRPSGPDVPGRFRRAVPVMPRRS